MNNFPAGGAGGLREVSLSDLYSAVTENGQSGVVLIENEDLSGGSFVLPYSNSIDVIAVGENSIIYLQTTPYVEIIASATMDYIMINASTGEETFVEIRLGDNMENFASGWSARYFTIN